jgi:L-threonylcarbamoyladenylate synthase
VSRDSELLAAGRLAVVPTDTVYGVGCAAGIEPAVAALYALKQRPASQATAVVAGSVERLLELLGDLPEPAVAACRAVLPGPVTLVVPNPRRRFAALCGDSPERIGVRVPLLTAGVAALADAAGGLALTSANLRGEPPPRELAGVAPEVLAAAAIVIDGGVLRGEPSCVIDVCGEQPRVLRSAADVELQLRRLGAG